MSYYDDVYKKRVGFRGDTKKDILIQEAEKQFLENLAESPNTESVTVNGISTKAILLTNKSDASKLTMYLHATKAIDVRPGYLVSWGDEHWMVLSTDKFSAPAYSKSVIIRCNLSLKYIDSAKVIKNTPVVFLGTLDSVLREAVYRQMGMAVQLDDRRAMILLPNISFKNNTRLMLDKRVWRTVDYDSTSNKQIVYVSLQEDNIDASRDDLVNEVADGLFNDEWEITLTYESLDLEVGGSYPILPTIIKNKVVMPEEEYELSVNAAVATIVEGRVEGVAPGSAPLTITLKNHPEITKTIVIKVADEDQVDTYEIVGDSEIRQGDIKNYQLFSTNGGARELVAATWSLTDVNGGNALATLKRVNSMTYAVRANEQNLVGQVRLAATLNGVECHKIITIKSLW